jgi:hypothetical protein
MMVLENILRKNFSQSIGGLVLHANWEDLNETILHMLKKIMIRHVDMFGTRARFGKPSKLQCTGIVFKNFAIHIALCADDMGALFLNFLYKEHDWKDVSQRLRHQDIIGFGSQEQFESAISMPNHQTICMKDHPSAL